MKFALLRDLFAYAVIFAALLLISKIGTFSKEMQHAVVILMPLLFVALNVYIQRKFAQDFDNSAYFSAIFGVATFAALGSFSQQELVELGFKVQEITTFTVFKIYFHTWAIVLLPIALRKFFKKA